jgi:hypothetical protein
VTLLSIELLNLNPYKCDLNATKFYTICSTRPDLNITSRKVISIFSRPELQNAHDWKYETFDYDISQYGFRDIDLPEVVDFAAFGCSFTFGQAMPLNKLWHKILTQQTNLTSYNFGQPGTSVKAIVDIFNIVSRFIKFKKAIFLLPNYLRQLAATQHKISDTQMLLPLLPNYQGKLQENYDIDIDNYFKYVPETELIRIFKDNLFALEDIAKQRNIQIYLSSWDRKTYEILSSINFSTANLIPEWHAGNVPDYQTDLARDKQHPGFRHHEYWANEIKRYITA